MRAIPRILLALGVLALLANAGTSSAKVAPGVDLSSGDASYVAPGYGSGYLALPDHRWGRPGIRVRICGPATCSVRTSTDSGPDLPMQRAGRIADLSYVLFGSLCGCDPSTRGTIPVTVERLGRGPEITLPPTDTE